jgi:hypothetical protein
MVQRRAIERREDSSFYPFQSAVVDGPRSDSLSGGNHSQPWPVLQPFSPPPTHPAGKNHFSEIGESLNAPQQVWDTRCNNYTAEVILYGRPYNAPPGAVASASFYFWQNGVRTALYDYNITTSETDANLRYL